MLQVQQSSNHYFQRPDAKRLSIDSGATSMTGVDWRMTIEKRRGRHWTGSVWAAQVTPGYEINDLGFSNRQEVLDGGARIRYREIQPGRLFRSYNVSLSTFHNWSHDALEDALSFKSWQRAHVNGSFFLQGELEFLNYWSTEANLRFSPAQNDRTATRGGPLMSKPRSYSFSLEVQTDRRRSASLSPRLEYEWRELGAGRDLELGVEIEWRPSSRMEIEVEPQWSARKTGAQFVGSTPDLSYAPTFGRRYLFGDLDRQEFSFETRVNFTVSPTLSFQLFAQPLLSSGDYVAYKQFLMPETFSFEQFGEGTHQRTGSIDQCLGGRTCVDGANRRYIDFDGDGVTDYGFNDRDFSVRSLIGNAVLRWEYRPGSTVFLVWQRQQSDRARFGRLDVGRDLGAMLRAPAENVFMIKVNYWIGL